MFEYLQKSPFFGYKCCMGQLNPTLDLPRPRLIVRSVFTRAHWSQNQIAFFNEFKSGTRPLPKSPEPNVKMGRLRETYARLHVVINPQGARLDEIESLPPAQGHGGRALGWLCTLADRHQIQLDLQISPFGEGHAELQKPDKLALWYWKRGFISTGVTSMIRAPRMR